MSPHFLVELEKLQRDIDRWNKELDPGPNARFLESRNKREGKYAGQKLRMMHIPFKRDGVIKFKREHIRNHECHLGNRKPAVKWTQPTEQGLQKLRSSVDFSQLGIRLIHPRKIVNEPAK